MTLVQHIALRNNGIPGKAVETPESSVLDKPISGDYFVIELLVKAHRRLVISFGG